MYLSSEPVLFINTVYFLHVYMNMYLYLPLTICVTLGKLYNLFEPQSSPFVKWG